MADTPFNIALGRAVELYNRVDSNDPANSVLLVVLLAASGLEAHSVLRDVDTLAAVYAGATNEATNTGYSRKVLTDSDITAFSPDDTSNRIDLDVADQVFTSIANDGTGAIGAVVFAYDNDSTGGTDSSIVPISLHDFAVTPSGGDITVQINSAGFYRASGP